MARPTAGVDTAEAPRLNLGEVVIAAIQSTLRRTRLIVQLATDLTQSRRPAREALRAYADGNESDLEELTLRWRLAGVRWPILLLMGIAFLGGYQAGRRSR